MLQVWKNLHILRTADTYNQSTIWYMILNVLNLQLRLRFFFFHASLILFTELHNTCNIYSKFSDFFLSAKSNNLILLHINKSKSFFFYLQY